MLVSTFNQEKALVKLQSSRMFVSSSSNYTPWLFLLQITFSAPHSGLTNLRVFIFFKFFFHRKKLRLIYFISRSRSSKHNATIAMLYAKSTKNIKKCFCTLKASSHKLPQLAICYATHSRFQMLIFSRQFIYVYFPAMTPRTRRGGTRRSSTWWSCWRP